MDARRVPLAAVLLVLAAVPACKRELAPEIAALARVPDSVSVAREAEAIQRLRDGYATAFATGDPGRVAYYFTEDAAEVQFTGDVRGAEEGVYSLLSDLPLGSTVTVESQHTVVAATGDVAYDVGRYTLESVTEDGIREQRFRYVAGLKKVDQEWKIDLMMISAPMEEEEAAGGDAS